MLFYILKAIAFIPLGIFVYPTRVIGRRNIPKKGRMIFCPNHQTLNDPIIIALRIHSRKFHYMAKAPLFKYKFSNWFLRSIGAFPVHHGQNDIEAVKTTLKHLKNDKAMCIFPEGARLRTEDANDLKNGVVNFALKTGAPIVPSVFVKKTNAFTFNTFIIGKPFNLSEMEQFKGRKVDKELLNEASAYLKDQIHGLRNEYLDKKEAKRKERVFARKVKVIERHRVSALRHINTVIR